MRDKIISILLCTIKPLTVSEIGSRLNFGYKQDELLFELNNMVSSEFIEVDYINVSNSKIVKMYSI